MAVTNADDIITVIRWGAVTTSTFLGTAATLDTGTAAGELPTNADLATGAFTTVGTAATANVQTSATDITANALMAVGAFGLGADGVNVTRVTDLDTVTATGFYVTDGTANARPSGASSGRLTHQTWDGSSDYGTQIFQDVTSLVRMWMRTKSAGAWNAWHEIITANAAGNVGIGTSSPIGKMQIAGTSNSDVFYLTDNNEDDRGLMFSNSSNGIIWDIDAKGASGSFGQMSFSTNGSERMRIDSSGRLLINRTASTGSLNLESQAPSGYSVGSGFYSGSTQSTIEFKDANTTANYKVRIGSETDDLVMFAGGSERLRIDSAGKVSVGTKAWVSADANVGYFGGDAGQTNHISFYDALDLVRIYTAGSERMRINATGGTSITADSPSDWATAIQNGTGTNAHGLYVNSLSSSGVPFRVDSNGSERMRIDSAGRISMPHKAVISGRMGSAMTDPVGPIQLKFNLFYTNTGGISYDSSNGRFTVPVAGKYRVTMNPFKKIGTAYPNCRVLIGKNNSTPMVTNHFGHCYASGSDYNTLCLNSVIAMEAGDFIVFYLQVGSLYNKSSDQFNDFSIEMIA